jgi:hypothetical protein
MGSSVLRKLDRLRGMMIGAYVQMKQQPIVRFRKQWHDWAATRGAELCSILSLTTVNSKGYKEMNQLRPVTGDALATKGKGSVYFQLRRAW